MGLCRLLKIELDFRGGRQWGIRTPGTVKYIRVPGEQIKPLSQLSINKRRSISILCLNTLCKQCQMRWLHHKVCCL